MGHQNENPLLPPHGINIQIYFIQQANWCLPRVEIKTEKIHLLVCLLAHITKKKDNSVAINYLYTNMQQKLRNMDTLTIQISVIMCASRYINTALMLIIIHFIKSKSGNRMLNFSTLTSNLFHDIQCYLTCRPAQSDPLY